MMGEPGKDPNQPYPDVRSAFTLTLMAMLAAAFTGVAFLDFGLLAAVGIGQAIGVGAVATMGAKRVAEPQAERLGLRALESKSVPVILCLAPAVLLVSELDNFAADWSNTASPIEITAEQLDANPYDQEPAAPEFETNAALQSDGDEGSDGVGPEAELAKPLINPEDPWNLLSAFIVMVGISPVVEEFLFRGVIQQGLVQRLGLLRGVTMVALLWTLLRPAPIAGFTRFLAAAVASFGLGWALGIVRIATGSILGSILLASLWAGIGLGSVALEGRLELPGMNVEGTHLPWSVTIASAILVAWAGRAIYQEAARRFTAEHKKLPRDH
jgi:membrane protease YdiL (CAAX protease family)